MTPIIHSPAGREPTRLIILNCEDGLVTSYERAHGLSNNVRQLARGGILDWKRDTVVDRASLEHFRTHPADYQPEPPTPENPRAA